MTVSDMTVSPSLVCRTSFGLTAFWTCRFKYLNSNRMRATLMAPAVEPVEAPISIRTSKTPLASAGHRSKLVLEKPVVVIMEET